MKLTVKNLSFAYGERPVLADISFTAKSGRLLSVLGPNGVGKSTLFRCVLGLLDGYSGTILLDGEDTKSLSARQLAHRIAYIPQTHYPAFNYSVFDMVLMGTTHSIGTFSAPKKQQIADAEAALCRMGIEALRERSYQRLSGGEQQMVLIARALAQRSSILLMDEPTASLDYGNQHRVLDCVSRLAREDGLTVILSTHNPQHALTYADDLLAISCGRILANGASASVLNEPLLKELYGVEVRLLDTDGGRVVLPVSEVRV